MTCDKCGKEIDAMNHFYVPTTTTGGYRLCIQCAKTENVVTLV